MTAVDNEDSPEPSRQFDSGSHGAPPAEEGLELMKAFQKITSPSDRAKVIALARELAGKSER